MFQLFLLFVAFPAAELALLIYVGTRIGALTTIGIIILTAFAGAALLRIEGFNIIRRIALSLEQGVLPADEMINGAMALVAGAMLLAPGFITDVLALALLFPPTRALIRGIIKSKMRSKITVIDVAYRKHGE